MKGEEKMTRIKEIVQQCGPGKIVVMIVCGILLLVLSWGHDTQKSTDVEKSEKVEQAQSTQTETEQYRQRMETQVEEILSYVEGVGNVEVMLTLKTSGEKVTLKDYTVETGKQEEESVLLEDENNNNSPYVVQEKEPEVEGILVVCQNGDNPSVQREIIDGISALFPVESHKIKVMKSKEVK